VVHSDRRSPRLGVRTERDTEFENPMRLNKNKRRDKMMMRRENLRGLLDAMSRGDVRVHVVVLSGTDGPVARKRGRIKERLSTFTDSHDEKYTQKCV
jgi:hypothetical protein